MHTVISSEVDVLTYYRQVLNMTLTGVTPPHFVPFPTHDLDF